MFSLRTISKEAIPAALDKAMRYRLLNEPAEAESICLDVLAMAPENEQALVTLLLALTDRFGKGYSVGITQAREVLARLRDEYDRAYYAGVICERRAKAVLNAHSPGAGFGAYEFLREAMDWYEKAEAIRPAGNDDAILRWNACARMLNSNNSLAPRPEEAFHPQLE